MSSPINPIVSGILHGFELAHAIKGQRLQQEAFERQKQRDEEDTQVRDLQTKLAMRDRNMTPATPDQEVELATGATIGPAGVMPSDIAKRSTKFKGTTYVGPSQGEIDAQGDRAADLAVRRKTKETQAVTDIKTKGQIDLLQKKNEFSAAAGLAKLTSEGFTMTDENAKLLGLTKTGPYPPEKLDDYLRALHSAKGPGPHVQNFTDLVTGNVTPTATTVGPDGKPIITRGDAAPGIARPKPAASMVPGNQPGQEDAAQASADAIANYKLKPPPSLGGRYAGANQELMRRVLKANPEYDAKKYDTFQKTENAFTSGREAKNLNSLNTALGHLGTLNEASDALSSGNVVLLNRLANAVGVQTGKDAVTTYNTIVHRVGPELVSAYVAGGGGQGERGMSEKDFDPARGDKQLKSSISISAKLLGSKIAASQQQYNQGTYGKGQLKLLSPESEEVLRKLTEKPAGGAGRVVEWTRDASGNPVRK